MSIIIAQTVSDSILSGVSWFELAGVRTLCAIKNDGSQISAQVSPDLISRIKAYHRYQTKNNAPRADCPECSEMLSAIEAGIEGGAMQTNKCYLAWLQKTGCDGGEYSPEWFSQTAKHIPQWNESDSRTHLGVRMFAAGWSAAGQELLAALILAEAMIVDLEASASFKSLPASYYMDRLDEIRSTIAKINNSPQ